MSLDFAIYYKRAFRTPAELSTAKSWDLFLSAFNATQRVKQLHEAVTARQKVWVVHQEYGFAPSEVPSDHAVYAPDVRLREDEFIQALLDQHCPDLSSQSVCVDISGFMRPHLIFLVRALAERGVVAFDAIYSEPNQYVDRERTKFAEGQVTEVRPIAGFEGSHGPSLSSDVDLLIVGAGYEHELMQHVAYAKTNARKLQMFGFPPLQADFYQENRLNAYRAAEAVSALNERQPLFAPSNDPFVTATVLQETVVNQQKLGIRNVYLCPLASRPQALGFALYAMSMGPEAPMSIIYPFSTRYSRDTASGISRLWLYQVELA